MMTSPNSKKILRGLYRPSSRRTARASSSEPSTARRESRIPPEHRFAAEMGLGLAVYVPSVAGGFVLEAMARAADESSPLGIALVVGGGLAGWLLMRRAMKNEYARTQPASADALHQPATAR